MGQSENAPVPIASIRELICTLLSEVQPAKALLCISLRLSGSVTEASEVQFWNTPSEIMRVPSGTVTSVSAVQPVNKNCGIVSFAERLTLCSAVQFSKT